MDITYTNEGGIMIPNLKTPEAPKEPLGIYGRMRRAYLKTYRHGLYSAMMLKGTLLDHLAEVDKLCHEKFEIRVKAFAKALDEATTVDPRISDILSTKGSL